MLHAWFISLLAVVVVAFASAEDHQTVAKQQEEQTKHSLELPLTWSPPQKDAENHPSQFLLLVAMLIVVSFIGFMSKASKSRRTKKIPKAVAGKTCEMSSSPSVKVISPVHDEEFGCPSTCVGSGSDISLDDEDEDWGPDWAQDPFSDKMPEACSSWKCTQFDNQHMLSMDNLERGSKVGANPFEDDVPLISRAKGKAD
mmetsp:Transcript_70915/g.126232  ORF Transcript_70915/g.126232 Transcript_70915/m.126232 type:complete len:199 (+) Transcript_70915:113-709(+)